MQRSFQHSFAGVNIVQNAGCPLNYADFAPDTGFFKLQCFVPLNRVHVNENSAFSQSRVNVVQSVADALGRNSSE